MDYYRPLKNVSPVINRINRFLASPLYIVTVMLLTVIANIFSAELVVYSLFAAVFAYTCLLGHDMLPLMPLFICCYLAPSAVQKKHEKALVNCLAYWTKTQFWFFFFPLSAEFSANIN